MYSATPSFSIQREPLRLAAPPYIYLKPLCEGLESVPGVRIESVSPREIRRRLEDSSLDCGLLPLLECVRVANGKTIPGVGASARGYTGSECIYARMPLERVERVAVSPGAGGCADAARLLIARASGKLPEAISWAGSEPPPDDAGGVVCGGGLGHSAPAAYPCKHDIGALWQATMGLPLVLAMWVGRRGAPFVRLRQVLAVAQREGGARMASHIEGCASEMGADREAVRAYFQERIEYGPASEAMEGARALVRMGEEAGLIGPGARLVLC